jgi:hypothetical protein
MEARNQEMEKTLASMGEMLWQHTSWWATAHVMLDSLEQLALPSIFVGGHAFLRGIQNKQTPKMASLLLHILSTLPGEIGHKIAKIRKLIVEVKSSFGVIVPAYCWDEGWKTFERIPEEGGLAPGSCMSQVPQYLLNTTPKLPVIPQLLQLQDWAGAEQNGINHNSPGPDLNRLQG